jgi:hypothetical protein
MSLSFELHEERGRTLVAKGGTIAGFLSAIELAPDDGTGVVVLSNTGALDNRGTPEPLAGSLIRLLLGLPQDVVRDDIPPRPEVWRSLCGWYAPGGGPVTNVFNHLVIGAGVEVTVRHRHLVMTPLTPIPSLRAAMELHLDDPDDPRVYRVQFPQYGKTYRIVFTQEAPPRLLLDVISFEKQPDWQNPRRWVGGFVAAGAAVAALRQHRHARR